MGVVVLVAIALVWAIEQRSNPRGGRLAPEVEISEVLDPTKIVEPAAEHGQICELLALAAAADPSLQRAASRPAVDIDDTAALQQQVLEAAADLLDDEPDASIMRELANAFAPAPTLDGGERTAGSWTDAEWADALIERATVGNLEVLAAWDARCS